jgi:coenzyme PQQ precursor peptide PqqA
MVGFGTGADLSFTTGGKQMKWTAPKVVEVSVGMEIKMYACAARRSMFKNVLDRMTMTAA